MDSAQKRILVVEDDEVMLKTLHDALAKEDFAVYEARDGEAALVIASEAHPDLILLDILMPRMDGWEMLRQLRAKDDWGKCAPVIILTNLSGDEDTQILRIAELGPSFFMEKADWRVDSVADKVKEILQTTRVPCP